MKKEMIVTYQNKNGESFADGESFDEVPRIGEYICIAEREWYKVTAVIHQSRQHSDGPDLAVVAVEVEAQSRPQAILKKSDTRDG